MGGRERLHAHIITACATNLVCFLLANIPHAVPCFFALLLSFFQYACIGDFVKLHNRKYGKVGMRPTHKEREGLRPIWSSVAS